MSLNKRSLKRDAKPEPSLESQLVGHERALKSRRGANRRAAFDGLRVHDEDRALKAVLALVKEATGKNRVELGALLVSTGDPKLVDDAVRGKFGDVLVYEHATIQTLTEQIEKLPAMLHTLLPAEAVRRARALGLVPRAGHVGVMPVYVERAVLTLIDDERLPLEFRRAAVVDIALASPAAAWVRRDNAALVPVDVALAAGLGARYVAVDAFDIDAFVAAVAALTPLERAWRARIAKLPHSADRFWPDVRARLYAFAADAFAVAIPGVAPDNNRQQAVQLLAKMNTEDADVAVLARADVDIPSTVAVCQHVQPAEALPVLLPLMRKHADVRDAVVATKLVHQPAVVDVALAVLVDDPFGAMLLLAANGTARAVEEILRIFEECPVDDTSAELVLGIALRAHPTARQHENRGIGAAINAMGIAPCPAAHRRLRVAVLDTLLARAGSYEPQVRAALRPLA